MIGKEEKERSGNQRETICWVQIVNSMVVGSVTALVLLCSPLGNCDYGGSVYPMTKFQIEGGGLVQGVT